MVRTSNDSLLKKAKNPFIKIIVKSPYGRTLAVDEKVSENLTNLTNNYPLLSPFFHPLTLLRFPSVRSFMRSKV
jgi:hypothetical protein